MTAAGPDLFWLSPGAYVSHVVGGGLYRVVGIVAGDGEHPVTVRLVEVSTGAVGFAQPWQLDPAEPPG